MCYVKDGKFFYAHQLLSSMSIFLSHSGSFEETPTTLYYWMIKQNGDPLMWKVTPFFYYFYSSSYIYKSNSVVESKSQYFATIFTRIKHMCPILSRPGTSISFPTYFLNNDSSKMPNTWAFCSSSTTPPTPNSNIYWKKGISFCEFKW